MRQLKKEQYESPVNQNRDNAIIGFSEVKKCKCEMPAKVKGRKMCYRCKNYLE